MIKHKYKITGVIAHENKRFRGYCVSSNMISAIKACQDKGLSVLSIAYNEQVPRDAEVGLQVEMEESKRTNGANESLLEYLTDKIEESRKSIGDKGFLDGFVYAGKIEAYTDILELLSIEERAVDERLYNL